MNCKICNSQSVKIFEKWVLYKYNVGYYQCPKCEFIQTDEPIWLEEAYNNAITNLDIGLLNRNLRMLNAIPRIIDACFPEANLMLDFAGGYGIFTRLMRDEGFNFFTQDVYCENIFAKHFDIRDTETRQFDLMTAFEVFEHFADPLTEIGNMFKYSGNIIFSTELLPQKSNNYSDWWYISEETGQHIAFYSFKTLAYLANKFGKNFYSKNHNLHLFTDKHLNQEQVDFAFRDVNYRSSYYGLKRVQLGYKVKRTSLLEQDFNYIRSLGSNKQ